MITITASNRGDGMETLLWRYFSLSMVCLAVMMNETISSELISFPQGGGWLNKILSLVSVIGPAG